jgi:hypothetical protein
MKSGKKENFVREILIVNGIGDFLAGGLLLFIPQKLAAMIRLPLNLEGIYLSGG